CLNLPLTKNDRSIAEKIANQFNDFPQKKPRILENILAVCAVKRYLEFLDIATDIKKSYSFNLIYQLIENVADLYLSDIGRLECRPVKAGEDFCYIPAETWYDRIGYVAVELSPDYSSAKLLGFVEEVTVEKLPLQKLNPFDDLLDTIAYIELVKQQEEQSIVSTVEVLKNEPKNLDLLTPTLTIAQKIKDWKKESLKSGGWLTFEEVFGNSQLDYAYEITTKSTTNIEGVLKLIETIETTDNEKYRQEAISLLGEWGKNSQEAIAILTQIIQTTENDNTRWEAGSSLAKIAPDHHFVVSRIVSKSAQLLNIGLNAEGESIALCISLLPTEDEKSRIRVWLQLRTQSMSVKLPPNLKLSIISETNEIIKEISSRADIIGSGIDDSIEMRFLFVPGQNFQVQVTLEDKIIIQKPINI
ncbi:DUF1822 family protein, partial [Geminocystis sp. GBBB08]|uniref:DUF1822 family protein n=1 Tax=Geminocystis sp. GBBB08 TaxID=2604140 RepID=UPI0027E2DEAC